VLWLPALVRQGGAIYAIEKAIRANQMALTQTLVRILEGVSPVQNKELVDDPRRRLNLTWLLTGGSELRS
jgi:hypothetical protein